MPFVKGRSGNPTGKRPMTPEQKQARDLLRKATVLAITTLTKALSSDNEDTRVRAASTLLAKGLPSGVEFDINITGITDEELLAEIDRRAIAAGQLVEPAETH